MLEPQKLLEVVPFVHDRAVQREKRADGGVREVVERAACAHGVAHEAVDDGAGGRVVRQGGVHDRVEGVLPAGAAHASLHAHGQIDVRLHEPHGLPEPGLQGALAHDVLRVLVVGVGLEHGGEQALGAAVVDVGHA